VQSNLCGLRSFAFEPEPKRVSTLTDYSIMFSQFYGRGLVVSYYIRATTIDPPTSSADQ
ncbi:hypothetical protein BgiBS90_023674, partial [Biomphalaria glabrata]